MKSYPVTERHAAEKLGYRKVPVIIRVLSEDDSILSMVIHVSMVGVIMEENPLTNQDID